jgi:DDE superfamily endonuclease
LNSEPDARFETRVIDVCQLYHDAPGLAQQFVRVLSTDEMTGVQALERKHPTLAMTPGQAERREQEYIRHGTLCFIVSRDVATGQVVAPSCGPTRTERDFVNHVRGVVATDAQAKRWHFVADNLNTHCSESLVRYVAEASEIADDLGVKGAPTPKVQPSPLLGRMLGEVIRSRRLVDVLPFRFQFGQGRSACWAGS